MYLVEGKLLATWLSIAKLDNDVFTITRGVSARYTSQIDSSVLAVLLLCLVFFLGPCCVYPSRGPLVIVDFTASWCKPCQKMAPVFDELAKEQKGSAVFCKVDIDDLPEAFDGMSIPAFHVRTSFPWSGDLETV